MSNTKDNELGKKAVRPMKLGKAPAKLDARTLKLAKHMKAGLPTPPEEYNFYDVHTEIPKRMFANDRFGDCVVVAGTNFTIGAEVLEQGVIIPISDQEVIDIYFRLTGGPDVGLVVLDFLKFWRNNGLDFGGHNYKIKSFASINWRAHDEVKWAIIANVGVMIGLSLPVNIADQFQRGVPWDVTDGPGGVPGTWGGHAVHGAGYFKKGKVVGYNKDGILVMSWGELVLVTWDLLDQICDEMYAIFDEHDSWDPDIFIPPVVEPTNPRPQTDEHHDNPPGELTNVVVQIKPGEWNKQQVADFFSTLSPDKGVLQETKKEDEPDGTSNDVESWQVGAAKISVYYNSNTGIVSGVTYILIFYT